MDADIEIYPMPLFPSLEVGDTEASSEWYQETLGFTNVFTLSGPGGRPRLVHLRWTKYADLLLVTAPPIAAAKGVGITLSFTVPDGVRGVDALADRARRLGANFVAEPGNRPWNARDFTVADPDGFRLTFTAGPVNADLSFTEVMETAKPG
jgi:uncharacterized glyoxalase superfamily protein PhnB